MSDWDRFESINGKKLDRVMYGTIKCLQNGRIGDRVSIMPANPTIDLGNGPGTAIWVPKTSIITPNK